MDFMLSCKLSDWLTWYVFFFSDYVAYRNMFIQILVKVFNDDANDKHLLELQTKVSTM